MPFGLKNAGATYQRLVNKIFKEQLGKTMEAYVDDMLVKSMEAGQHCKDLRETFELLRRYHMRLNPSKCVFGVSASKFLGFMVTHRGIEANPDKIRALLEMEAPRTKKEIQLVVEQLKGEFEARDPRMKKYLSKTREYIEAFVQFDIEHVPRAENKKADALAKLASATGSEWKDTIYLERIGKPSYEEDRINSLASEFSKDNWRASLFLYLQDGSLPRDNKEAQKVRRKAARYTLMGRELYRRSLTLPYLRCLSKDEGEYIL
ncbi:uncharacterized protein LOC131153755 [Malania oleifera]|uniref:uncharacterized protein LOC131153755 n=1 Tax=Malania oleifera TaxID=397392 RepID=UPI0025ADCE39|nr:uncharacterized protein LOC131153755 [Malania oleifera]